MASSDLSDSEMQTESDLPIVFFGGWRWLFQVTWEGPQLCEFIE